MQPQIALSGQQLVDRRLDAVRPIRVADVNPERATMRGQPVHIEQLKTVRGHYFLNRNRREVRVVLVVKLIELVTVEGLGDMWKLECRRAASL